MSNNPRENNYPNPNGQMDPYRRDINNPNTNNPNLINTSGNINKPRANLSKWGKPVLKNTGQNKINNNIPQNNSIQQNNNNCTNNNNDFNKNNQFNENKFSNEARPYESSSPSSNSNNSQSNFNRDFRPQERYNDERNNYQSNKGNFYDAPDNRYNRQYDNRNMPNYYHDSHHQANSDYRGSNYYPNDSNYGHYHNNYDSHNYDRDRFRRSDRFDYEKSHRSEDYDRDRSRANDRYESHHHHHREDRDEERASLKRYSSSSTTSSASSASISSSSSTNIHRTNSLPKGKLQPPKSPISENISQFSTSPLPHLPSDDSDVDISTTPLNTDDNHKKNSNTISSSMVSRQEVVEPINNFSEVPESIKKLTKGNTPDLFISNQPESKEIKFSKPKKKEKFSFNASASARNQLNDTEPKNKINGLTLITKKSTSNYSSSFENGISPFPEVKKSSRPSEKDQYFNSFNINSNLKEWIENKLFDNSKMNNQSNESDKILSVDDDDDNDDLLDFIREFNFDDVLKRRDWQNKPESFIKKISSSEFDLDKNNDPIEAFIVSNKNDPFYCDMNLFTLEPVETEEEKISNLLKKFNLPDIHKYIENQENKNKDDIKKATQKLREKSS